MRGVWSTSRPSARRVVRESPRLEHLAQQRDEDDLGRHERLADHQGRQARLRQGEVGADPTVQQRLQRPIHDVDRPEECGDHRGREAKREPSGVEAQHAEDEVQADQAAEEGRERDQRTLVIGGIGLDDAEAGPVAMVRVVGTILAVHRMRRSAGGWRPGSVWRAA